MTDPVSSDWCELHHFEDGEAAHDITTAVLSMEYEASLVDCSTDTIVSGVGSELDPNSAQAQAPFVLKASESTAFGSMPGFGSSHMPIETDEDSKERRTQGGPWRLMVRTSDHDELAEVLETLLEEWREFEAKIQMAHDDGIRFRNNAFKFVIGAVLFCLLVFILVRIFA